MTTPTKILKDITGLIEISSEKSPKLPFKSSTPYCSTKNFYVNNQENISNNTQNDSKLSCLEKSDTFVLSFGSTNKLITDFIELNDTDSIKKSLHSSMYLIDLTTPVKKINKTPSVSQSKKLLKTAITNCASKTPNSATKLNKSNIDLSKVVAKVDTGLNRTLSSIKTPRTLIRVSSVSSTKLKQSTPKTFEKQDISISNVPKSVLSKSSIPEITINKPTPRKKIDFSININENDKDDHVETSDVVSQLIDNTPRKLNLLEETVEKTNEIISNNNINETIEPNIKINVTEKGEQSFFIDDDTFINLFKTPKMGISNILTVNNRLSLEITPEIIHFEENGNEFEECNSKEKVNFSFNDPQQEYDSIAENCVKCASDMLDEINPLPNNNIQILSERYSNITPQSSIVTKTDETDNNATNRLEGLLKINFNLTILLSIYLYF